MVAEINRFRARVNWGIFSLAAIGVLIFIVFWPLLKPTLR